jgi:sec-independent protein translocase protein TatC
MNSRFRLPLGFRTVGPDERLSIVDHLHELRRRLITSVVVLVVAFAVAYLDRDSILHWLTRPLPAKQRHEGLITLSPTEPFITVLEVCLWTAILIALPVLLYQIYAFVIPAVGRHSRRRMLVIVAAVSGLFLGGVVFGYYLVLPVALKFLLGFGGSEFTSQVRAQDYFGFVATLLFATGFTFEVPLAMAAFARMGLVTPQMYRKQWRLAIVGIAAIAAFLPTADPFSMLLVMLPMIALYLAGIWLASIFGRPLVWRRNPWGDGVEPAQSDDSVAPSA